MVTAMRHGIWPLVHHSPRSVGYVQWWLYRAITVGEGRLLTAEAFTDIRVPISWDMKPISWDMGNGRVLVSLRCHLSATWPKKMPTDVPARIGVCSH